MFGYAFGHRDSAAARVHSPNCASGACLHVRTIESPGRTGALQAGGSRPMRRAAAAFERWLADAVAPIAHSHGLTGRGPTFRKRDGENWVLFVLERRPLDPIEAMELAVDPRVPFRMNAGISVTAVGRHRTFNRPPGPRDITMYSEDRSLDPPDGGDWHIFVADDPRSEAALTSLIADGLGPALEGLGDTSARAILARRLSVTGPFENLSPGEAMELLAMTDVAGDTALRAEIVAALDRERVPDPIDALRGGWVPLIGQIRQPIRPRRRTRPMLERLVRDLHSDRVHQSRSAASLLGGWDGDTDAVAALRAALGHCDGLTRGLAALGLGHLADTADTTWHRALALADDAEVAPWDIGAAIVLLSRLDGGSRRPDAEAALDRLRLANPAWSPDLRAFKDQLAVG